MRITTNMIRRNYMDSLNSSMGALEAVRRQAETGRKFSNSYEDPASAAEAIILESRYARNNDYINTVENTMKWQDTQESVLMQIEDIAMEIEQKYSMEALNGTNWDDRDVYATLFDELQRSMVNTLNTKYSNSYVMAGADGLNAPFQILDDGTVTYRGLNVDDVLNTAAFDEMAAEKAYVDMGFGLTFDATGEIDPASAFNAAIPGIEILGYGEDADGVSNNMLVLIGEMSELLREENFNSEEFEILWEKFGDGAQHVRESVAEIGAKSQLMDATLTRLEDENLAIIEQFDSKVNIDAAEAITDMTYKDFVYNLVLKVGSNLLTPSLLDFIQ